MFYDSQCRTALLCRTELKLQLTLREELELNENWNYFIQTKLKLYTKYYVIKIYRKQKDFESNSRIKIEI